MPLRLLSVGVDGRVESFDETVNKDVSKTNLRRRKNSGFRRFRHLMKKPDYSRKFWTTALSVGAGILIVLLIWDWFFRYPNNEPESVDTEYLFEAE